MRRAVWRAVPADAARNASSQGSIRGKNDTIVGPLARLRRSNEPGQIRRKCRRNTVLPSIMPALPGVCSPTPARSTMRRSSCVHEDDATDVPTMPAPRTTHRCAPRLSSYRAFLNIWIAVARNAINGRDVPAAGVSPMKLIGALAAAPLCRHGISSGVGLRRTWFQSRGGVLYLGEAIVGADARISRVDPAELRRHWTRPGLIAAATCGQSTVPAVLGSIFLAVISIKNAGPVFHAGAADVCTPA